MVHKTAFDTKHGKGLKILTPKQMLQKLPNKLLEERTKEGEKLYDSVNFKYFIYLFKGSIQDLDFHDFIDVETLFDGSKFKRIRFGAVEKNQMKLKSKLSSAKIGGNKSDEQLRTIEDIRKSCNLQRGGY